MAHPAKTRSRPRLGLTLALLAFSQFIIALDYNIVFVALPEIGAGLDFSAQTLQWVVSGYAVAFGGFLLLGGRAADLLGRRRMFVLGMSLYAVGSLVGGLATATWPLIAARAAQGLGGALLFPATLALINTTFAEGRDRNRALAVWSAASAVGLSLGSLLGGVLTNAFGWESVFLVNVPLGLLGAVAAFPLLAADGPVDRRRSFDLLGALTATAGVTAVVFALVQGPEVGWADPSILIGVVLGAVLLVVFARTEARSRDPLMPLRLLRHRSLVGAMAITAVFMATFGIQYYFLTLHFQQVLGFSALATGLAFLPQTLVTTVGTLTGERLIARFGIRATLASGLVLGAIGMGAVALAMSEQNGYLALLPGIVLLSLGQGFTWTGMWIAAGTGVAPVEQGVASGMASTAQQVGGAVGLALLVALAGTSTADGLRTAVAATAVIALVGALLALRAARSADV
ncbi:MFS transporter [Saccharopolyspora sp. NPDC050642]|uniref:MFS transporter n=1 Tax=Saccharopolyspora sp. NPDC050642 TaxID=3157099 RepID=UPI0033EC249D